MRIEDRADGSCAESGAMEMLERKPMSRPKTKTQAQLDRTTNQRLLKTYGITLKDYKKLCKVHDENCWICGRPPGTKRLAVEHDHSWKKVKIQTAKGLKYNTSAHPWTAWGEYNNGAYCGTGKTRSDALRKVREEMRRDSVRGVACSWCNRGLRYYHDRPDLLESAAAYLRNFQAGQTHRILGEAA